MNAFIDQQSIDMVLIASWTAFRVTPAATQTLTRSSHALIAHAGKAYIFGGELTPRISIDGELKSGMPCIFGVGEKVRK